MGTVECLLIMFELVSNRGGGDQERRDGAARAERTLGGRGGVDIARKTRCFKEDSVVRR